VFWCVYVFCLANLLSNTLLGLFYLTGRIHRPNRIAQWGAPEDGPKQGCTTSVAVAFRFIACASSAYGFLEKADTHCAPPKRAITVAALKPATAAPYVLQLPERQRGGGTGLLHTGRAKRSI
jgi:hypothetical protein